MESFSVFALNLNLRPVGERKYIYSSLFMPLFSTKMKILFLTFLIKVFVHKTNKELIKYDV